MHFQKQATGTEHCPPSELPSGCRLRRGAPRRPSFSAALPATHHVLQDGFSEELVLPLEVMPQEGAGQTYVVLARPPGSMALGRFVNILRFRVKEIDPSTGARPSTSSLLCALLSRAPCSGLACVQSVLSSLSCSLPIHGWPSPPASCPGCRRGGGGGVRGRVPAGGHRGGTGLKAHAGTLLRRGSRDASSFGGAAGRWQAGGTLARRPHRVLRRRSPAPLSCPSSGWLPPSASVGPPCRWLPPTTSSPPSRPTSAPPGRRCPRRARWSTTTASGSATRCR